MNRHVCLVVSLCLCGASSALAQPPVPTISAPAPSLDLMAHYNFHLSADGLSNPDKRFSWEAHFGGDFDLVDYVVGRANVLIDYEVLLGDELRIFDPNQGNYTLEVSGSVRAAGTEFAGVFHHMSRHLSDRTKQRAIAWNVAAVRVLRRFEARGTTVDLVAGAGRVVARADVDYAWTGNADVVVRRPVHARVGVFARALGEIVGVDQGVAGRQAQHDGRLEGGVRLEGRAGAVELFAGYERRIDAYPTDPQRLAERWAFAGFRFVNR